MCLHACWCCGPGKDVAGGGNEGGKRRLAMKKESGTQVIHCDFAAMANLSGCVSLALIYVKGEKKTLKKIPDLVIKTNKKKS